jgi:hypothetical protein
MDTPHMDESHHFLPNELKLSATKQRQAYVTYCAYL